MTEENDCDNCFILKVYGLREKEERERERERERESKRRERERERERCGIHIKILLFPDNAGFPR